MAGITDELKVILLLASLFFTRRLFTMKILVATEKPFAKEAVNGIKNIIETSGHELILLEKYKDKAELLKAVETVDALIVRSDKVTKEVVSAAQNLKIVVRAGAGYDNIDLDACNEKNIVVMNTPGQNSNAVAELAIGMMLCISRNCFTPGTGTELRGKTLGIHAFGNVGRIVAKYGKALGMDVYVYHHSPIDAKIYEAAGVTPLKSAEELYSKSQYLSLHIPANEKTKKSINYDLMSKMPKGAVIINTARKEVVDEEGLKKILAERPDFKYATDIAADCQEELNSLFDKRVLSTPKKMGAETAEANVNAGIAAANQIVSFFKTGDTKFQVNKK